MWQDPVSRCDLPAPLVEAIARMTDWAHVRGLTLGIAGSFGVGTTGEGHDLDVLIVDPDLDRGPHLQLPDSFLGPVGRAFNQALARGQADVFGYHDVHEPRLHVEVYPEAVARRILELHPFTVRRLRRTPLSRKPCYMVGTDGQMSIAIIDPHPRKGGAMYSELPNVLLRGDAVSLGMHVERLLLAVLLQDDLRLEDVRQRTWTTLARLIASGGHTFDSKPERIFFVSPSMSPEVRRVVRSKLLGGRCRG